MQEWVIYAAHLRDRTFLPPADSDPLSPTFTGAGFGGCCVALAGQGTAAATGYRVTSRFGEVPSVIVPPAKR